MSYDLKKKTGEYFSLSNSRWKFLLDLAIQNCKKLRGVIDPNKGEEFFINPKRLSFAEKQKAERGGEEKYNCYFGYSKTQCHRYVLVINAECIVCTIIKINRRWQHIVEKNAKI